MTTKTISQITSFSKATLKRVLLLTAIMSFFASYIFAQDICLNDTLNQQPQFYDFGAVGNDNIVVNGLNQFGWTGSSNVANSTFIGNSSYSTFNYNGAVQTFSQPLEGVNHLYNNFPSITIVNIWLRSFNDASVSTAPATLTIKYAGITLATFINPAGNATGDTTGILQYPSGFASRFSVYAAGSESSAPFQPYRISIPEDAPTNGIFEIEFNGGSGSGVITDDFQIQTIEVRNCGFTYYGAVYLDNNGMNDGAINGTGISTADGNQLRVGLVNTAGQVVDSTNVHPDGTFWLTYRYAGNYTLRLLNLPATYINTGEKLGTETTASDGNPNGITSEFFTDSIGSQNTSLWDVLFGVQLNPALPVTFGNITASFDGSQLIVNWNSIAETNNDHYEVEVSRDGVTFTSLGTVASKAENGNSNTAIDYNFTKSQSEAGSALGWLVLPIPFLLLAFTRRNRRTLALGVLVSVISLAGVSCNKSTDTLSDTEGKLYVRIAQVDKDGTKSYSKTIQVVRK